MALKRESAGSQRGYKKREVYVETQDSKVNPAGEAATVKRPKTGGRVKKSLDQLMAQARMSDEIAGMNDDTTLPEELAAIYLCISVSELAELRKAPKKAKRPEFGARASVADAKSPRLKMLKPIRDGAVGQNQKVFYKLAHLRAYQESITVESSFEAAVKGGLYGFVTIRAPFFAKPPARADRGRTILIAKAWDKADGQWAKRFKDVFDGKLRAVWLTPAEAASSRWMATSAHKAFAKLWLAALEGERQAVKSAIEGTLISVVVPERIAKRALID